MKSECERIFFFSLAYIAVKYQVLSKDTAFIGVIKQDEKVIGEIEKVSIEPIFVPKKVQSYNEPVERFRSLAYNPPHSLG
jgi:hypothetical protein